MTASDPSRNPREPTRTGPREPTRTAPREPTRTAPREPTRTAPREPTRTAPREPTRTAPREPTRTAGRPSLRERSQAAKGERIRAAALALFKERGFEATTTREVADRASIAAGTLFLYVRNKEELLDFVFAGEIERVVDARWASLPRRGDLVTRLMHLFDGLYEFYARDLELARLLVRHAVLARQGGSTRLTYGFLGRLAELVAEARAAGQLGGTLDPGELAIHAFTLYLGGVFAIVNGVMARDAASAMALRALEVHFAGLRPTRKRAAHKRSRS
jgi:AcrR family transcriptional regulator